MQFKVKAINGKDLISIDISANDEKEALALVKARGLVPLSAKSQKISFFQTKRHALSVPLFTVELLGLLEAGLNLVEALETLADKGEQRQQELMLMLDAMQQGKTFSAALEQQSNIFPLLLIATIKASEKTGDIKEALSRYISYQQQIDQLKKKIISASIYPMLLIMVGGLVIAFLLGFVVPKFSMIYQDTSNDLPYMSKLLLLWGEFLAQKGELVLLVLMLALLGMIYALTRPSVRAYLFSKFWQIPSIGYQLKIYQLSRFFRTVGMLLKGGSPIVPALKSASGLLERSLHNNMQQAELMISEGKSISQAMTEAGLTTSIATRMLIVGERGGNIDEMMTRIATFYDEELSRWLDWFTRLFEPILMLIIGLVIGVVVLLLYMPIFELAGNIQ